MKSEYKLSVIIPLYNAGGYFRDCMESLTVQTWKDPEIIVVNDGSTGCSADIVQHYAEKYPHARLLHQASQGISVARNLDLDAAAGDYITFVDADDRAYPKMYKILMGMVLHDNLDIVQSNTNQSLWGTSRVQVLVPTDRLHSTSALSGPDWLCIGLASRRWTHVLWMRVYKNDPIREHNIRSIPGLHYQDITWGTVSMFNVIRVKYTEGPLYKHYQHDGLISHMK